MQVHGLELARGEPAFAFCVLRLRQATARSALFDLVRTMAPLIPDSDTVIEDLLPEDLEQALHIIAVPWQPPTTPAELASQQALVCSAGIEEAWFFQTGTSLPPVGEDEDDEDPMWSHGAPPQLTRTRFPVDGTDDADTEDFGIAIKLAGEILAGEGTVLLAFHTLWLAPYGGRYRNSAVTIDRKHHSAHLWVDRFEVASEREELVGHLLWIVAKLDEVVSVVHARFASATMAQKYGELLGDDDEEAEPFVLGGNPLMAAYALGGESGVDDWIAEQTAWANEEVAHMLREVAVEIVTTDELPEQADDDRGVTQYAGEILLARAKHGRLDPRSIDPLIRVLDGPSEDCRLDAIAILGAARARAAVAPLVDILRRDPNLAGAASTALGQIGDPAAAGALAEVIMSRDYPAAAAEALAALGPANRGAIVDALLGDLDEASPTLLFAIAQLAQALPNEKQAHVRDRLAVLDVGGDDPTVLLARETALVMLGAMPSRDLAVVLHEGLSEEPRVALHVAALVPSIVDRDDLASLTTVVDEDIRAVAHALLARRGEPLPEAPRFDRYAVRELRDEALIQHIGESRVIGRAALIAEAARRRLTRAIPAIVDACHDIVSRPRIGDSDARILEVAVPFLRKHVDEHVISLFERMLRQRDEPPTPPEENADEDATNDDDQAMN